MKTILKPIKFSLLFILILATSCEKDDCNLVGVETSDNCVPLEIRYMNDTLKDYYFFHEGSWWVYERTDTIAGIYDTAVVTRSFEEPYYILDFSYQIEWVVVNIQHSYYEYIGNSNEPEPIISIMNSYDNVNSISIFGRGPSKLFQGYVSFLSFPIDSINNYNNSYGTGEVSYLIREYDTIINGVDIHNVLELNQRGSIFNETIHIAPNVGIVKFENSHDSTQWVLKEFQVSN